MQTMTKPATQQSQRIVEHNDPARIRSASHLMVLPVPLFQDETGLYFELQAVDGMERWLANFDTIIAAAPLADRAFVDRHPEVAWTSAEPLKPRVQFVPLPMAYKVRQFATHYLKVRATLSECIDHAEYLQFGIGALAGDWAGVAAELAIKKGRSYAVHMDRVEYKLSVIVNRNRSFARRSKARLTSILMQRWHHRLIGRASLALCNGQDTLNAFGKLNAASYLIHDLHVDADRGLAHGMGDRKRRELRTGSPLKLCYTGRFDREKAPQEWVRALAHARHLGSRFEATWLGDGPLRVATEKLAAEMGLEGVINFPGFVADRERVMRTVAESHAMIFTHVTPESPRCLLEALMHATPIIGYETGYSKSLTQEGGSLHVPNGDYLGLGKLIFDLDNNRESFARLVEGAMIAGRQFSGSEVFRFRSELIKRHLVRRC